MNSQETGMNDPQYQKYIERAAKISLELKRVDEMAIDLVEAAPHDEIRTAMKFCERLSQARGRIAHILGINPGD